MIGTRLGNRYEVLREIGRGGMGVVYAARDPMLDREVAVKLLAPAALTPESEARFRSEARIVAAMDHPAIVSVYDVGEHDGALFLVLPLVKGANLRRFLEQKLLTDADIVEIGIQVADALEHSHSLGVVHRDIKPENIIVARDGNGPPRVRLTDFGLALSAQQQRQTRSGSIVGSMSYLTPEQISRRDIDARSDIYSLGTVLFECFTGSLPFETHFPAILWSIEHDDPRQLSAVRPDLPPPLASLIMSCLAKSPGDRPQSASEIVNMLRSIDLQSTTANERIPSLSRRAAAPIPSVMEAPTVGREETLRLVRNRLDRAIDGDGQLVVIGGAAGVGKTRLIEELRREAQHRNVRVLGGRFSDTGVPYQAYCEAIEEYFVKSSAGDVTPLADLARDLAALFPSLNDVAALRALLPASEPPLAPTDRTGIFEQLSRAFVRLAGGRPLLLVLEETHDADVSLEALQFLFRRFRPHPIMVVATFRSDDAGKGHPVRTLIQNLRGDPNFVPLDLAPLSFDATHELIVHLLRSRHVDDQVIARIWESAEGNPLFTMELVKAMLESGMIFMAAGVWQLSRRREWEELPATIQETVARRIERLPEQDRRLLSTASILGRRFDLADLELLLDDSVDLDATVQTLLDSGIINEEREARGDVYSFAGAAMRDVLYTSLPRRRRRTLHLRYATELERRSSRSDRVVPELLHHFANADAREKVFEYGLPLAQRYLANVSAEDAMRIARIVLDMVDEESRDERLVAGEAKCVIAAAQRILGHTDAALVSASEAFALFEGDHVAAAARAARIAADTAWERRRLDEARHWVERGIVAGRAAGDRDDLRKLLSLSATIANVRGDHATAQLRLEEAEALGPAETESARASGPVPGVLHIALNSDLTTLDPALSITIAQAEIMPEIFDTLTRATDAARIEPWLAESLEAADGGRRYDVRLRAGVTFHDGSPVTSADVRYSFERLLRSETGVRRAVLSSIAGASRVLAGSGEPLEGFQIRSELEFSILLERPVAFFPALLTNTATSIIPAHSTPSANSWRDGCLGSGPFRLVRFEPGNRVELEANPFYWRRGFPRCEKLVFSLSVMPEQMRDGFLRGRYSVVRDLYPADVEALRSDPRYAPNYREVPLLSTYYLAINGHRGPLTDEALRRELVKGIDVDDLVTRHVGREGIRALSFTPPGLLGHDPEGPVVNTDESTSRISPEPLAHLTAMLNSAYQGPYAGFAQELLARLEVHGFPVRVIDSRSENFSNQASSLATADLLLTRWIADYPDGHDFVGLFHSRTGIIGQLCGRDDVDALIDRGEVELDPAVRHEIYREIFAILRRHTLLLPLFHEQAYRFARPDVDGFELSFTAPTVAYEKLAIRM
jgi:ABC-type transport system substrate-binding protein